MTRLFFVVLKKRNRV